MFSFFRRQKPREDKSAESKQGKDVQKSVLPIRLIKNNDDKKKACKNHETTTSPDNGHMKSKLVPEIEVPSGGTKEEADTKRAENPNLESQKSTDKISPANCDRIPAFTKSTADSCRLAFFEDLLQDRKISEDGDSGVTSRDARPPAPGAETHATCKCGSDVSEPGYLSSPQTAERGALLCDKLLANDTSLVKDTIILKDALPVNDSVLVKDALPVNDSIIKNDTIYVNDSVLVKDALPVNDISVVKDTILLKDALPVNNSVLAKDALLVNDSVIKNDTICVNDSVLVKDTLPVNDIPAVKDAHSVKDSVLETDAISANESIPAKDTPPVNGSPYAILINDSGSTTDDTESHLVKDAPSENGINERTEKYVKIDTGSLASAWDCDTTETDPETRISALQDSNSPEDSSELGNFSPENAGSNSTEWTYVKVPESSDQPSKENLQNPPAEDPNFNASKSESVESARGLDSGEAEGVITGKPCDKRIPTILIECPDDMGITPSSVPETTDRERCSETDPPGAQTRCDWDPTMGGECGTEEVKSGSGKCESFDSTERDQKFEESGGAKSEGGVDCDGSDGSDTSDEKSESESRTEDFLSGEDEEKEDKVGTCRSDDRDEKSQASTEEQRLNLVNKDASVHDRLHELTTELANREAETIQLRYQLEEAQKQLLNQTWGMDRCKNDLLSSHHDSEGVKERLKGVENDRNYNRKDSNEDAYRKERGNENGELYPCPNCEKFERSIDALNRKVRELEEELATVKRERDKLEEEGNSWEVEREQEIKIMQQTLADAQREKEELRKRFEKEFESLRTVNTDREQHLLDDFEWKLREVEQASKKRLQAREEAVRNQCLDQQIQLKDQIQELQTKIKLHHSHEAELSQLRGLSNEQQRSLKVATRQVEQLQNSEKLLKEEIDKLKALLQKEKTHLATMQGIHNREIAEKERKFQFKLDQYKTEVNSQVDEKVQRECARLRIELERNYKEERRANVEAAKQEMEKEFHLKKQNWDRRMQECIQELELLQKKLANKDKEYKQELEKIQTMSDRDMMELRRKLDKTEMSYQEKLEKVQEKCDKEIERINCEREKRLSEREEEVRSVRAELEELESSRAEELEERLAESRAKFEEQLREQREELLREREEALAAAEQRHGVAIDNLRNQLDSIYRSRRHTDSPQQDSLMRLHQELSITSESSTTDEGCIRGMVQASDDEFSCLQSQEEEDQVAPLPQQVETNKSKWKDKKFSAAEEGCIRDCAALQSSYLPRFRDDDVREDDVSSALLSAILYAQLDENRERTGNTQVLQTRSSRRKRRSRGQRGRMNINSNFAPA
nr:PREDICTED: trichohyalin-like isoform X2 [Bemisia tabaci]